MEKSEFETVLEKYLAGTANKQQQQIVEEWFNGIAGDGEKGFSSLHLPAVQKAAWINLTTKLKLDRPKKMIQWRRIAASVFIVLGCSYLFKMSEFGNDRVVKVFKSFEESGVMTFQNAHSFDYHLCLPDGSSVVLKPGSEVKYPLAFGAERHVLLKGKAFFDVVRDVAHPFVVQTKDVTTRVLGTSFWVHENPSSKTVEVSVKTGKVMVYAKENNDKTPGSVILQPNQKGVYNQTEETLVKKIVDEPIVVDRSTMLELKYENTPVTEIFYNLQKVYGIPIRYNTIDLASCALTTELNEENLFERIQIICNALGLEYRVGNDAVIIEGKCK